MRSFLIFWILFAFVNSCDKITCSTRIDMCENICTCDIPTCECCPACFTCLDTMWSECCDCFNLCTFKELLMNTTITKNKDNSEIIIKEKTDKLINITKTLSHCSATCIGHFCDIDCPVGHAAMCECTLYQDAHCYCK